MTRRSLGNELPDTSGRLIEGTVIPFPNNSRPAAVELYEAADKSGWVVSIEPVFTQVEGGLFDTKATALAYAQSISAITGWRLVDWTMAGASS